MAQTTDIKLTEKENNGDNIKLDSRDNDLNFNQLLEGMEPSDNDFEKEWNEAMTGEEFWGEIEKTIRTHFKNKE